MGRTYLLVVRMNDEEVKGNNLRKRQKSHSKP